MQQKPAGVLPYAELMTLLGLDPNIGRGVTLSGGSSGSRFILSTKTPATSRFSGRKVPVPDLETLCKIVNAGAIPTKSESDIAPQNAAVDTPKPWPEINGTECRTLHQAIEAAAFGQNGDKINQHRKTVEKHFFPMLVSVYAAENLYIKAGQIYRIEPEGHDPVVLNLDTLTLEEGGQIQLGAPALINVQTFNKVTPA